MTDTYVFAPNVSLLSLWDRNYIEVFLQLTWVFTEVYVLMADHWPVFCQLHLIV